MKGIIRNDGVYATDKGKLQCKDCGHEWESDVQVEFTRSLFSIPPHEPQACTQCKSDDMKLIDHPFMHNENCMALDFD